MKWCFSMSLFLLAQAVSAMPVADHCCHAVPCSAGMKSGLTFGQLWKPNRVGQRGSMMR